MIVTKQASTLEEMKGSDQVYKYALIELSLVGPDSTLSKVRYEHAYLLDESVDKGIAIVTAKGEQLWFNKRAVRWVKLTPYETDAETDEVLDELAR